MKILITGGSGFIGLHTARALLDDGHDVVATQYRVRREPPFIKNELGGKLQREQLDTADSDALRAIVKKYGIERIVHLAVPGLGALSPEDEYRANTVGLINVLQVATSEKLQRVVLASSLAVYHGLNGPLVETLGLPVASANATSAFKKAEEILGMHYADRTGLDLVAARIGIIYGPLYHTLMNLPSRVAHATAHQAEVKGIAEVQGNDRFDYCYVKDCATALKLLTVTPKLSQRIYNVASGKASANNEFAAAAQRARPGTTIAFAATGGGPQRDAANYLDLTRITADTGYKPAYDVDRAMAEYIDWLGSQEF